MHDRPVTQPEGNGVPPPAARGEFVPLRLLPGATEPDDFELTRRLRHGNAEAFAALYDRYSSAVFGLTRAILRDDRLAEEATHDVFLGLWQQPYAYEASRGAFVAWLLRVARNRAIDLLRRRREQPFATTVTDDGSPGIDVAGWLVDPDPDPAEQAVLATTRHEVQAALADLSPDHRRLLELAYFGGLTQREIADLLNRPLGTVKTQIRTAMRRLADLLLAADPALGRSTHAGEAHSGVERPPSEAAVPAFEAASRPR